MSAHFAPCCKQRLAFSFPLPPVTSLRRAMAVYIVTHNPLRLPFRLNQHGECGANAFPALEQFLKIFKHLSFTGELLARSHTYGK